MVKFSFLKVKLDNFYQLCILKTVDYLTSETEITRRKKAYTLFSISLVIGIILSSSLLNFPFPLAGYMFIITVLLLIGLYSFRFFRHIAQIKIRLSDRSLSRCFGNFTEEYLYTKIMRAEIIWTTNKTIREIYLWLTNDHGVVISALNHFENFKKALLTKLDNKVSVKEKHELLEFDHPFFYPALGLMISFLSILVYKALLTMSYRQMKIGAFILFVYLIMLGIYICVSKPISKRSGAKTLLSDYLVGGLMISLGLILFFFLIIYTS